MSQLNAYNEKRADLIKLLYKEGIKDKKVLSAINRVKRELFVSDEFKKLAYRNSALPIKSNQTISQPYTVAFMTELLEIQTGDKILEVGTGSGYQAAVLNEMGGDVYSVERVKDLYEEAKLLFRQLELNIHLKCGDGSKGWKEFSPYNKIIVTAGAPRVPKSLISQLVNGGKMVIPKGGEETQELYLIKKEQDKTSSEPKLLVKKYRDFKFVPLIGEEGWHLK
jgi:protein-L-isoaspartate(D-aspartate) O-methyltransferase